MTYWNEPRKIRVAKESFQNMKWQNLQVLINLGSPILRIFFEIEYPVSISLKDLLSKGQNWKKVHKSCKSRTNGIVGAAASNICNSAQCFKQWKVMENYSKSCTVWKLNIFVIQIYQLVSKDYKKTRIFSPPKLKDLISHKISVTEKLLIFHTVKGGHFSDLFLPMSHCA